jgi:hypothetical protein
MDEHSAIFAHLEYIKAAGVRSGEGSLEGFAVRDVSGTPLGELAGVLIDLDSERLRYLVVSRWGDKESQISVLPIDGARLDPEHRAVVLFDLAETIASRAAA